MKILGFEFGKTPQAETAPNENRGNVSTSASLFLGDDAYMAAPWTPINYKRFNGEKTPGELGNPSILIPDYRALRIRAHQANFTRDIVQIITRLYFDWVVGSGLKMQAAPQETVLELEGIKEDFEKFRSNTEAYFNLWAHSTMPDAAGELTLHDMSMDCMTSKFLGGDSLIVLRVDENYNLQVQVIDGQHLATPFMNSFMEEAVKRGNTILHGIELDKQGQHVAYYVAKQDTKASSVFGSFERIEAFGKESKCRMAWIAYGKKMRIDHKRGVPEISAILEKVTKLDRYTEATVGSAEERAKLPWFFTHDLNGSGENPLEARIQRRPQAEQTPYEIAVQTSKAISVTEGKTVYNLPQGADLKTLNTTADINYEPFFKSIFQQICASVGLPPEVALQMYNSNYSASRAAIKSWEHRIKLYREKHSKDFYQKVYNAWLYIHVLQNKVDANGYQKALNENNRYVTEAYSKAKFTGVNMPHIDPLKEANAIRVMLGDETTPLMTYDQATEQLNNGEFSENIKKVKQERKDLPPPVPPPANPLQTLRGDNVVSKPAQPPAKPAKTTNAELMAEMQGIRSELNSLKRVQTTLALQDDDN